MTTAELLHIPHLYLVKLAHLVHTVQELQEDGCKAAALAAGTQVAPLAELVAEGEPLLLQQHLETLQSPVERITQQLHQTDQLKKGQDKGGGRIIEAREACVMC